MTRSLERESYEWSLIRDTNWASKASPHTGLFNLDLRDIKKLVHFKRNFTLVDIVSGVLLVSVVSTGLFLATSCLNF